MAVDFDATVLTAAFAAFGIPVTYQPVGGAAVSLHGVFEESLHDLRESADGALVDTAHPVLGIRIAELLAAAPTARTPQQGDSFVLLPDPGLRPELWNTSWRVKEAPGPDGAGHIKLGLMGPQ